MDSILSDMRDLEVATLGEGPRTADQRTLDPLKNDNVSDWATQYLESGSKFAVRMIIVPFSDDTRYL